MPACCGFSFTSTPEVFSYSRLSLLTPVSLSFSWQISRRTTMCGTRAASRSAIRRPASLSLKTLCAQGSAWTTTTTPSVRTCCPVTPRGEAAPGACCTIRRPTWGKTGILKPYWRSASSPRRATDASRLLKSSGSISPSSAARPGNDRGGLPGSGCWDTSGFYSLFRWWRSCYGTMERNIRKLRDLSECLGLLTSTNGVSLQTMRPGWRPPYWKQKRNKTLYSKIRHRASTIDDGKVMETC